MPLRPALASSLAFALSFSLAAPMPLSAQGITTKGDEILDAAGEPLLLRGINVPHAWYEDRTEMALKDVAATGANAVRVVLSAGGEWGLTTPEEVTEIVALARQHGLVAMLEVHNATGWGEREGAMSLPGIVPYWLSLKEVLEGTEGAVMINLANEPTGNGVPPGVWYEQHAEAIRALREAGFSHTLVVDGPNWGQDAEGTMQALAPRLAGEDPQGDTVFSVHMYQVYDTPEKVWSTMRAYEENNLPLIVGEFGMDHQGDPVDEGAIFEAANALGVGYIGWSWSGNAEDVADLDIVEDFDPARLSPWGERLIHGKGGIEETSRPANVSPRTAPTTGDR